MRVYVPLTLTLALIHILISRVILLTCLCFSIPSFLLNIISSPRIRRPQRNGSTDVNPSGRLLQRTWLVPTAQQLNGTPLRTLPDMIQVNGLYLHNSYAQ
jgi:hypothetical protein